MSTTTRSWRQLCIEADPDFFGIDNTMPVVYEICCGRFRQPRDPYDRGYVEVLASDDLVFVLTADDGETILVPE